MVGTPRCGVHAGDAPRFRTAQRAVPTQGPEPFQIRNDNAPLFVSLSRTEGPPMTEPNKEPVRIALPPRPDKAPPSASTAQPETGRILLPSRVPWAPVRRVPPKIIPSIPADPATKPCRASPGIPTSSPVSASPVLQPLPKPPGAEGLPDSGPGGSTESGPKHETLRIVNLTKAPLSPGQPGPLLVASEPQDPFDAFPRAFCWSLFGIAALIFLIQIWNYVVS